MTLPEDLQVDREHERAAFRGRRALDERARKAAVLHHIELEPEGLVDGGGNVLDRADRQRAQRVWNAGRVGGATGEDFPVAPLKSADADRCERDRQRGVLSEDCRARLPPRNINEHPLA